MQQTPSAQKPETHWAALVHVWPIALSGRGVPHARCTHPRHRPCADRVGAAGVGIGPRVGGGLAVRTGHVGGARVPADASPRAASVPGLASAVGLASVPGSRRRGARVGARARAPGHPIPTPRARASVRRCRRSPSKWPGRLQPLPRRAARARWRSPPVQGLPPSGSRRWRRARRHRRRRARWPPRAAARRCPCRAEPRRPRPRRPSRARRPPEPARAGAEAHGWRRAGPAAFHSSPRSPSESALVGNAHAVPQPAAVVVGPDPQLVGSRRRRTRRRS